MDVRAGSSTTHTRGRTEAEVSERHRCVRCKGRGYYTDPTVWCLRCNGTGIDPASPEPQPAQAEPECWQCAELLSRLEQARQSAMEEAAKLCDAYKGSCGAAALASVHLAATIREAAPAARPQGDAAKWERAWAVATEDVFKAKARISTLEQALSAAISYMKAKGGWISVEMQAQMEDALGAAGEGEE
jgi:hypothetical protein